MKHFQKTTEGGVVVMGRKTWESLPEKFRPLPGRTNIVVTRDTSYIIPTFSHVGKSGNDSLPVQVVHSIEDALTTGRRAAGGDEVFIIGGAEIYKAALPFTNTLYLTLIESDAEGDVFFPEYKKEFALENKSSAQTEDQLPYSFAIFTRK